MRPRASIALSMTVLLSTASFVSAPTFASTAAEASETSDYDGSSAIAPFLASSDTVAPPPPSPVPKARPAASVASGSSTNASSNASSSALPAPSPPPKAPPRLLPLQPLMEATGAAPNTNPAQTPAIPSETRVARPGAISPAPASNASPPLPPPSLTRVARPVAPLPNQIPAGQSLVQPLGQPPGYNALSNVPVKDSYPAIGQLEKETLGISSPGENIDQRLASLETAIFKKTFEYDSLFDRTERLKKTILGTQEVDPNSAAGREEAAAGSNGQQPGTINGAGNGTKNGAGSATSDWIDNPHPALESLTEVHYLDEQAALPENMTAVSAPELAQYAVSLLNRERQAYGVAAITPDNVAEQMAGELASDLAKRNVLSHFNSLGDGPDRRFTLLQGADALNEGIASVKTSEVGSKRMCKAAVARILKTMLGRQDDRDALLNPDATHIGFALALTADRERVVAAVEVLTRHAIMIPVASEVKVGDKIEVRGVLQSPYLFDKVTVAWESYNPEAAASAPDESEEALPYFPPLDYIAYSSRSEGNHDKAMLFLKTGLIVGAVGAGLFFPPAAMAVPLIALSGSPSEIKPVSDIPVKGGIKVDGGSFAGHIPLSNNSKPGLYYITVWAVQAKGQKSIPISRRVLLAKEATPEEHDAAVLAEEKLKEERKKKQVEDKQRQATEKQEKRRDKDSKLRDLTVEGEVEPVVDSKNDYSK